jgi:hypothetical protein
MAWHDAEVTLARSTLDPRVWTPVFGGQYDLAHSIDHAGGVRAVKRWSGREWRREHPELDQLRWVRTGEDTWALEYAE